MGNWIPTHNASVVQKFGYNHAVPNGSYAGVLSQGGDFEFLEAASTIQIAAGGDAADDGGSSPLGTGARSVTVEGLDATGAKLSETITTAGASASSATTASFLRVFRAYVSDAGTYGGTNEAAITIITTGGASPQVNLLEIPSGEAQSQHCQYTIPLGYTGYIAALTLTADALKAADFRLWTRENITDTTPPYSPARVRNSWDGVLGVEHIQPRTRVLAVPALTDVWIDAQGGGAITEVSADMEIVLVAD